MTNNNANPSDYPLTLYYDGLCPVCNLEMDNLKARNHQNLLRFVDISVPFFDPTPLGVSLQSLNELIHAKRPDGALVVGVEVFRLAYSAVGLGRWFAPTALPVLKPLADAAYALFARNRYGFSRASMPVLEWLRRVRSARRAALWERAARQATQAASQCHTAPGEACPVRPETHS
ncbi:MAG: thiol-disulfide oxidoreductase [Burkholderiales bacterium PBB3]|nr:MAG: thiol-disulfide oxidoreductase [Burkholderiales bacterium PBB3]